MARVVVIVLAAGAGSRFAADSPEAPIKLLALLDGKPLLQHVLDRVAALRPARTIVVLGHHAEAIEHAIDWHDEQRLRNHEPDEGLSSSVWLGLEAAARTGTDIEAALIVLGDHPLLSADLVARLREAAETTADAAFIVPRFGDSGAPGHPVLVRRSAWGLASMLHGERGFGPLVASQPSLAVFIDVECEDPDVDTPADLERLRVR
ncbi:MAG TPA: nucleotidyltransferase family protein [Candidatus Limnocylindrales bacterium]|nr:nucleotidyltransferase family protein [Candidatus Limnocylindrales bacterium]